MSDDNKDPWREMMLGKFDQIQKLNELGVIDIYKIQEILHALVFIEQLFYQITPETLKESGLNPVTTECELKCVKEAFDLFEGRLKDAYRRMLEQKVIDLEEGKLNVS